MRPTLLSVITEAPERVRLNAERSTEFEAPVEMDGGSRKAGIIRGASLISEGEALGHDMWIDRAALSQVVALADESTGVKVRFTHPSMSSDGLGSYLGRARDLRLSEDGSRVLGDVHFSPVSRKGDDRGGYVLELAKEDPKAFGLSIVFDPDHSAAQAFVEEFSDDGDFVSPAAENVRNLQHVRLSTLDGADFVDSPAANPDGLYHSGPTAEILSQAEGLLEYAIGITDTIPENTGGLSAERLRGFFTRFCGGRGITFQVAEEEAQQMSDSEDTGLESEATTETETAAEVAVVETETETATEPEPELEAAALSRADVEKFSAKFGADVGLKYLLDGVSFEDALSTEFDSLKQRSSLTAEHEPGEETPVGSAGESGPVLKFGGRLSKSVEMLARQVRINGRSESN